MEKCGLRQIGYIRNFREYPKLIREKAGLGYFNFREFDQHIDSIWKSRDSGLYCYNMLGEEVSPESEQILSFIIDTGFKTATNQVPIYAGFQRNIPSSLDAPGWSGVQIGTKDDIIVQQMHKEKSAQSAFESYTSIKSFQPIAREINKLLDIQLDVEECELLIKQSFETAQAKGSLAVVENEYDSKKRISFFPIRGNEVVESAKLFVTMEINKGSNQRTAWFGAFVVTEKELKESLLSFFCFHVGSFIFNSLTQANAFYNALAQKAMRENWKWSDDSRNDYFSQPILKSYLEYTYYRLEDEDIDLDEQSKKIISYAGKVYFNSGLLDRNFRQIIIVGNEYILKRDIPGLGLCCWRLLADVQAYSHNEHEIARTFREDELPAIASYFTDYRQVVFDASIDIHTNDNHIFEDGVARGRLPKYQSEYERVKDDEVECELLLTRIARDFDSARERAKLMAERNYKLAVPQFYKETNEIQFLLPIYLGEREEAERPQCALVLSLDKTGRRPYYRGETILTLDMAYNNTRLIAKPDVFWLNDLV